MTNAEWKCPICRHTIPYRKAFAGNDGEREYCYCPSCGTFMGRVVSCIDCKHGYMIGLCGFQCDYYGSISNSRICSRFKKKENARD